MLEYLALAMLLMSLTALFYIFIFIHDLPHRIAKKRGHPQAEAIHYACWLSLFTLHALWPLVFIWAVSKGENPDEATEGRGTTVDSGDSETARLRAAVAALEDRIRRLEASGDGSGGAS